MLGISLPARAIILLLALFVATASGCSWTGGLFGGSEEPEAAAPAAEAQQTPPDAEEGKAMNLDMGAEPGAKGALVPRPERSPQAAAEKEPEDGAEEAPATAATPGPATQPAAPDTSETEPPAAEVAAVETAKPEAEKEEIPEIQAKGRVPIERPEGEVATHTGDIDYRNSEELLAAVQKAVDNETFLGYTEPFDAFPVLDGDDTMSAAFIPVDFPHHKVFYHAFYQPSQPFHKRVYGYTVIDMRTNQDFGHFDGNADGIFEQKTLDPKIVIDDYIKASEKAADGAQQ